MQPNELKQLKESAKASACRSINAYCRKMILQRPVPFYYRNRSFDDWTEGFIQFRQLARELMKKNTFSDMEKQALKELLTIIQTNSIKTYEYVLQNQQTQGDNLGAAL